MQFHFYCRLHLQFWKAETTRTFRISILPRVHLRETSNQLSRTLPKIKFSLPLEFQPVVGQLTSRREMYNYRFWQNTKGIITLIKFISIWATLNNTNKTFLSRTVITLRPRNDIERNKKGKWISRKLKKSNLLVLCKAPNLY